MVDLQQIGELQTIVGRLGSLQSNIQALGDPSRLAGDPGALRDLAGSHRDVASELGDGLDKARGPAMTLTGGAWQGSASAAFSDFWTRVDGQVHDLASRHTQMASALEETAGRAESLNRQVSEIAISLGSWLAGATTAVATLDVAAVPGLVSAASGILSRWEALFPELRAFASGLAQRLDVNLGVSLPTPWQEPGAGGPPIGIPLPWLPGLVITTPGPKGPNIVITTPSPKPPNILITTPGPKGPSILITTPGPKLPNILITTPSPRLPNIQTQRVPPPRDLPAFPDAKRVKPKTPVQGGGSLRARWKGKDGRIYEWDSQHGTVEAYDRRGRSLGEYDPTTGKQTKGPDPTRRVEP